MLDVLFGVEDDLVMDVFEDLDLLVAAFRKQLVLFDEFVLVFLLSCFLVVLPFLEVGF